MNSEKDKNGFRQAIAVSLVMGVLFSSVVVQALHARAAFIDFEFEPVGLGEDGPYSEICGAQFDTYLLSKDVWKNRASEFAKDLINSVTDNLVDFGPCGAAGQAARQAAGQVASLALTAVGLGAVSSLLGGIIGGDSQPKCTIETKTVSAEAQEAAERALTYDLLTRCTATVMTEQIENDAILIAQTGGPDGGPTWVQDWGDVVPDAAHIGYLKALNDLSHVQWCEGTDQVKTLLNIPEPSRPLDARRDSLGLDIDNALSCNNPPGVPLSELEGDPYWVYQLSLPQNNLAMAYVMANQHIKARIALEVQNRRDELQANDGFDGISGFSPDDSCTVRDPVTQKCTDKDLVQVPGIVVKENLFLARQAQHNLIATSDKMGELSADMRPRMTSLAQDLTSSVLNLDFEPDLATRRYQDSDPGDPQTVRANSNPDCGQPSAGQCNCHTDPSAPTYSGAQSLAQTETAAAVGAAALRNQDLLDASGRLLPSNYATFITRVCNQMGQGQSGCRPVVNANQPPSHLLAFSRGALDHVVNVISTNGIPLSQNPEAVYTCQVGVLP